MGIHYDYKSTKSAKLMEKQAKREKKLAEKKAKRLAKEGPKDELAKEKTLDASKPITLDFLTILHTKATTTRVHLALLISIKQNQSYFS